MKDKEKRNKKGSESTIGKIIYGFLLFMPLFAIGVTCLITTFNKNVSYTQINSENIEYEQAQDLEQGKSYYFVGTNSLLTNTSGSQKSIGIFISNVNVLHTTNMNMTNSINRITFYVNNNARYPIMYLYSEENTFVASTTLSEDNNILFTFNFDGYTTHEDNLSYFLPLFADNPQNIEINNNTQDIFYYAVDKVTESPLFSWAENSIIYTTTANTCNALSITTPFIPLLLSYWLIISVMYFLYDIALMLIWVLHDRIHALKDSIT